jgi:hypothetical protein
MMSVSVGVVTSWIPEAAQLTSTAVALVALFLSFRNERRNQERFRSQLDLSRQVAEANVKPLLATHINGYDDDKGLVLTNHGAGTAVIQRILFRSGKRTASSVADLIELPREIVWNECPDFEDSTVYLAPRTAEVLLAINEQQLTEQGLTETEIRATLDAVEKQLEKISVRITYSDVLGNVIAHDEAFNA